MIVKTRPRMAVLLRRLISLGPILQVPGMYCDDGESGIFVLILKELMIVIFALGNPLEELLHESENDRDKGKECQYSAKRFEHVRNLPRQAGISPDFSLKLAQCRSRDPRHFRCPPKAARDWSELLSFPRSNDGGVPTTAPRLRARWHK